MKWLLTGILGILSALALEVAAHADGISAPLGEVILEKPLPFVLVGVVVAVTAFLLWKFWRKKR